MISKCGARLFQACLNENGHLYYPPAKGKGAMCFMLEPSFKKSFKAKYTPSSKEINNFIAQQAMHNFLYHHYSEVFDIVRGRPENNCYDDPTLSKVIRCLKLSGWDLSDFIEKTDENFLKLRGVGAKSLPYFHAYRKIAVNEICNICACAYGEAK